MGINDNILDDIMEEVGSNKADLSGDKVIITKPNKTQAKTKKVKKEWDSPIGLYLTKEEKEDFQMLCRFNKTSATDIARDLILKYLSKNNNILTKLKELEKLKSE